mmetsp:Transcript_16363/g.45592  ORF Transcript_16363/g.45592 Transcript_16363/m.45592 type:complete len:89 (-) Transcript_16363:380-646(-)|eukprot:CAMPEP_0117663682 /NCGR_PEP_ID=MMETSP0804-20121206/8757_1 /TAXON_ID=1074897 /ORGANISM="Tetraselmis astigmatica, Strain CCMP880" /LENGTH=88 /DNA_ID=CAMNT_0005470745 /DNA_START=244 /DNA_END=510 /DNA_ORIENTATION=-
MIEDLCSRARAQSLGADGPCQSPSPQFDLHLPCHLQHVEDSERGIFFVDGTRDGEMDEEVLPDPDRDYEEEDRNEYMEEEELGELELG